MSPGRLASAQTSAQWPHDSTRPPRSARRQQWESPRRAACAPPPKRESATGSPRGPGGRPRGYWPATPRIARWAGGAPQQSRRRCPYHDRSTRGAWRRWSANRRGKPIRAAEPSGFAAARRGPHLGWRGSERALRLCGAPKLRARPGPWGRRLERTGVGWSLAKGCGCARGRFPRRPPRLPRLLRPRQTSQSGRGRSECYGQLWFRILARTDSPTRRLG